MQDQIWVLAYAGLFGCAQMVIGGILGLCVLGRRQACDEAGMGVGDPMG